MLKLGLDDEKWLNDACSLARRCPPSNTAFSVGAYIVSQDGDLLATGHSREIDEKVHAEEAALLKVQKEHPKLPSATIYSSLEPCSLRASRPLSCTALILEAGVRRVVFAWREPSVFVDCQGEEILRANGVEVLYFPQFAEIAKEPNAHLLGPLSQS